jgi:hypothetical protein
LQLLEVSVVGASSIKVKHSCSISKARISTSLRNLSTLTATNLEAGSSIYAASVNQSDAGSAVSGDSNDSNTRSFPAAAGAAPVPVPAGSPTSFKVSYESFTLSFKDTSAANRAAAALLFQRAQHAAAQQWLCQGLHAGFRCEAVSCSAAPLQEAVLRTPGTSTDFSSSTSQATSAGGSSSNGSCYVTSCGGGQPVDFTSVKANDRPSMLGNGRTAGGSTSEPAAGAAAGAACPASAASCMPWASVAPGWGCTIPVPAS